MTGLPRARVPSPAAGSGGMGSYRLGPGVRFRSVGGEGIAVHQEKGEVVGFDEVGALVLELIAGGEGLAGIVAQVCARYEVEMATARADVERFIGELVAAGILEEES